MVGREEQSDLVAGNAGALRSLKRAISLSHGEFSLVLVCCNYQFLQEQILQQLQVDLNEGILLKKVFLPPQVRSLYSTIHSKISEAYLQPNGEKSKIALVVLGLESVDEIDDLLSSINQVRDEFRKKHPFPMVLWVNEELLRKLRRLAPDFASWAATPIKFGMTTLQLQKFLREETDSLFTTVLNIAAAREKEPQITENIRCSNYCLIKESQQPGKIKKDSAEQHCKCT
ncbi:MAG: hypothetical protein MJK14_09955 [Rivularia sp. ALOHA_DT_140]|nr:hypothetical protein [Rivularia sp. ALOHA_DT_140]